MFLEPSKPKQRKIRRQGFPDGNLKIGYAWEPIAWEAHTLAQQMARLKGCDKIFCDMTNKELGAESPRNEFIKMSKFLREGDTLVVTCLDRLESTLEDLISTVCNLYVGKINLQVLDDHIDTASDPEQNIFNVFDALGRFLETLWEKQSLTKPPYP